MRKELEGVTQRKIYLDLHVEFDPDGATDGVVVGSPDPYFVGSPNCPLPKHANPFLPFLRKRTFDSVFKKTAPAAQPAVKLIQLGGVLYLPNFELLNFDSFLFNFSTNGAMRRSVDIRRRKTPIRHKVCEMLVGGCLRKDKS